LSTYKIDPDQNGVFENMPKIADMKHHPAVLKLYAHHLHHKFVKDGGNYSTFCPFHDDKKTRSFKVYASTKNRNQFTCFGCGESGDIFDFLQSPKIAGMTLKQAMQEVEEWIGTKATKWQKDATEVDAVFENTAGEEEEKETFSVKRLKKMEEDLETSKEGQAWLRKRGITMETARRFHLGYRQSIKEAYGADHQDKGWIAIPYIDGEDVITLKYRSIATKDFRRRKNMRTILFNLAAIDAFSTVYVVEGEFDAMIMEQAGFPTISLPAGTNSKEHKSVLTPDMKDRLAESAKIVLAGDNDAVGNNTMTKLLNDELLPLKNTFQIEWPAEMKDANDVFLKHCEGDVAEFKKLILANTRIAKIMEGVHSIEEVLLTANTKPLAENPERFRFPWPNVDRMAILMPGSVMSLFATQTKQGKTAFITQATLYNALNFGARVLNYQCELSKNEFAQILTAHLLSKDRNHLTEHDNIIAAQRVKGVVYYFGRDETLNRVTPVLDLMEKAIKRLGATVAVLDHIHFICRNEKDDIKAQSEAMQRIKRMAQRYGTIWIVIGQPRKAKSQDRGKLVHITDLKGSESVGSDADAIFALHREWIRNKDPNNPPMDDFRPETEIHLLGARSKGDGPTMDTIYFVGKEATFYEVAPQISNKFVV
jgi:archaellum biogenesis ATPase FlaH